MLCEPPNPPEMRCSHEVVLVNDHAVLFGGWHPGEKYFPRNEIWVRSPEGNWTRHVTEGPTTPPPCIGARDSGIVYRLDLTKMTWIKVTLIGKTKPHDRAWCCFCSIGSTMVMFGGVFNKNKKILLQPGATQDGIGWNNEVYEFQIDKEHENGMWLDLKLSGTRPEPLVRPALAAIDQNRALLLGVNMNEKFHSFVMNLNSKTWEIIDFYIKPSAIEGHTICSLGVENKSLCLLIGGRTAYSDDYLYILDCDNFKAYKMSVPPGLENIYMHTSHCLQSKGKTADVLICGGVDWKEPKKLKPICTLIELDLSTCMIELTHDEEKKAIASHCEELMVLMRQKFEQKMAEAQCGFDQEMSRYEASLQKMRTRFLERVLINPDKIHLKADQILGSGSFGSVSVGSWCGITVAVKILKNLDANHHNLALFQQEVVACSRLRHPNIMTMYGAVVEHGFAVQMVMELYEGSVDEVIKAAHSSGYYLTPYEQLSIATETTSGIAYLQQIRPEPYVHCDIRPTNVLVTRDMKVKVGDLGAARLIESSLSAGALSLPYLAPERSRRADGTAASSTLSSDVYSLGVTLIEIFTGKCPIPEDRLTQLQDIADLRLQELCKCMITTNSADRPSAQECFGYLKDVATDTSIRGVAYSLLPAKRLVKGGFERDSHKVVLLNVFIC
ncbi:uncharacterized protein [Oscarella lobularis]|uniref:uncharacterized protein isoform X2 n=1 Tax=Oscarella lobularis TaxID=121494 RepID=UPI00331355DD